MPEVMMKALVIALTLFASLLTACDRQTLDGLRLQLQADLKSSYDQEKEKQQSQAAPQPEAKEKRESEQPVRPVQTSLETEATSDPDSPRPFSPLKPCSQGDIAAQTNERFYKRHPQLKSIDSKDKRLMKEWQAIQAKVEQQCQNQ